MWGVCLETCANCAGDGLDGGNAMNGNGGEAGLGGISSGWSVSSFFSSSTGGVLTVLSSRSFTEGAVTFLSPCLLLLLTLRFG